jgi:hypothetical protein
MTASTEDVTGTVLLHRPPISGKTEITDILQNVLGVLLVVKNESAPFQDVNLVGDGNRLLVISHCPIYKKRPALVRWSSGSVAGSVGCKGRTFI